MWSVHLCENCSLFGPWRRLDIFFKYSKRKKTIILDIKQYLIQTSQKVFVLPFSSKWDLAERDFYGNYGLVLYHSMKAFLNRICTLVKTWKYWIHLSEAIYKGGRLWCFFFLYLVSIWVIFGLIWSHLVCCIWIVRHKTSHIFQHFLVPSFHWQ